MFDRDDDGREGGLSFWPSFTDVTLITILMLIILYFTQLLANVEVFELARINEKQDELECRIQTAIADGVGVTALEDVGFSRTFREHRVTFSTGVLFQSGRAELQSQGVLILESVGEALLVGASDGIFESIQIEGHTDTIIVLPGNQRIRDNWDLASSRATQVVRFLDAQAGLDPNLIPMSAVGFSKYAPVLDWEAFADAEGIQDIGALPAAEREALTQQWLALNRRVEMKLYYTAEEWVGDGDDFQPCIDPDGASG